MKQYLRYIIFVIIVIVCVISTILIVNKNSDNVENIYTSELLVFSDGVEYEIKVNNKTKETIFRKDKEEEIIYKYPREGSVRISVPDFNNIEGKNVIEGLTTYVDYTYNVNFQEGCQYIKYLMEEGYEIKQYAINSQYFECFLVKEESIKRIILFTSSLMVCDLAEGVTITNVKDYFVRYNFNSSLDNKFG